MKISQMAL